MTGTHKARATEELKAMAQSAMTKGSDASTREIIRSLVMDCPDALLTVPDAEKHFIYHEVLWFQAPEVQ